MNANGKRVRIKDGVYHLSSATHLGGKTGTIIRSDDPYYLIEFDEPLRGCRKTQLNLHWSSLFWSANEDNK